MSRLLQGKFFDIDLYETPFRRYDATTGRFTGVDAMAEVTMHLTPYQFGMNSPVMYNDPTGLIPQNPNAAGYSMLNDLSTPPSLATYAQRRQKYFLNNGGSSEGFTFFDLFGEGGMTGGGNVPAGMLAPKFTGPYASYWNNFMTNVRPGMIEGKPYTFENAPGQTGAAFKYYYEYTSPDGSGVFITPNFHGNTSFTEGELYTFTGIDHSTIRLDFSASNMTQQASLADGNISPSDFINIGIGFCGSMFTQLEAGIRSDYNATKLKAKNAFNPNRYRKQLKKTAQAINKTTNISRKLGIAGVVFQGFYLGYRYNTSGITKKDAFDVGLNTLLLGLAIVNPALLTGVAIYGVLDLVGAFDGFKNKIGATDEVLFKK